MKKNFLQNKFALEIVEIHLASHSSRRSTRKEEDSLAVDSSRSAATAPGWSYCRFAWIDRRRPSSDKQRKLSLRRRFHRCGHQRRGWWAAGTRSTPSWASFAAGRVAYPRSGDTAVAGRRPAECRSWRVEYFGRRWHRCRCWPSRRRSWSRRFRSTPDSRPLCSVPWTSCWRDPAMAC